LGIELLLRLSHFEALRPFCPVCKYRGLKEEYPLQIGTVSSESENQIVEGILVCSNSLCQSEYPILDGVPILLPNLRSYISENIFHIVSRTDLGEVADSILGDCCSQGSVLDSMKQHLSCYVWGHYSDLDPNESSDSIENASVLHILEQGLALESAQSDVGSTSAASTEFGPTLDIGCGPGRTTIAIAEKTQRIALGIDLNFSMLRLASTILRKKRISYPRRRVGLVYDRREFDVPFSGLDLVDFWACDGLALPFSKGVFERVIGMNILDSVAAPQSLLSSIARVLRPNGSAVLACPYDWTASVTPVEAWIGGHSQRNETSGECAPWLRRILANTSEPTNDSEPTLRLVSELDGLPWTVRMHDRSSMQYHVHLVHARRSRLVQQSAVGALPTVPSTPTVDC
jgi:SAM-dependent methyltransferase/uncharacterized protein YbaR (Trm112 family)